jgi:CheY-like chemotaxis protein
MKPRHFVPASCSLPLGNIQSIRFLPTAEIPRPSSCYRQQSILRESIAVKDVDGFLFEILNIRKGQRVLLVEDEVALRSLIVDELIDAGFEVLEAGDGEEALARFRDREPDLLLTDIRLPGALDGWDIAEKLRARKADLPVVYMSGFSPVRPRQVPRSHFIKKPYRPSQIVELVQSLRE